MSEISTLPEYELNHFALWVARAAEKYFNDPENKRRLEEWKKEKREKERMERELNAEGESAEL